MLRKNVPHKALFLLGVCGRLGVKSLLRQAVRWIDRLYSRLT